MSTYLDNYGQADARRERRWKWIIGAVVLVAILAATGYFTFRDYREEQQAKRFLALLKEKNYPEAYKLWGCSVEQPCRDYSFERFKEDWGPTLAADAVRKTGQRSCQGGIIQVYNAGKPDNILLFVDRRDRIISFAPWEYCNPHWNPGKQ